VNEVELELLGKFREIFRSKTIRIPLKPGTSLLSLLEELSRMIGADLRSEFIGPDGKPMEDASLIIVNGRVADLSRIGEYLVNPGDKVVFSPSVAGGG